MLETGKTGKIIKFSPHIILGNNWKKEPSGNKKSLFFKLSSGTVHQLQKWWRTEHVFFFIYNLYEVDAHVRRKYVCYPTEWLNLNKV